MKTKIKTLSLLCFAILGTIVAKAQSGEWMDKPADERAKIITNWMTENLDLSSEQEAEVYKINLKYAEKGTQIKESSASKKEKFQTLKEENASKDEELKAALTDEQYMIYQDKKRELRQKVKENRKGGEG